MHCLVCGSPAKDITPGGIGGVVMKCPVCGVYGVAGTVQAKLAKLEPEDRTAALQKAQTFFTDGAWPIITGTSF